MHAVSVVIAADAARGFIKIEDIFDVIQEEHTESHHKHGDVRITAEATPNLTTDRIFPVAAFETGSRKRSLW